MKTPPPGTGHTTLRGTVAAVRAAALAWSEAILADPAADVDQHDPSGRTALMHAARAGDLDLLDRLLARSADPDRTDAGGETALMRAAWSGQVGAIDRLIAAGADADIPDAYDWTALMHAAISGHLAPVRRLLSAGARPDRADRNGMTALMVSVVPGPHQTAILTALIQSGADPCVADATGRTLIALCEEKRRPDLIAALDAALATSALADTRRRLLHSLPVAERLRLLPASHAMQCADDVHRGWRRPAVHGRMAP